MPRVRVVVSIVIVVGGHKNHFHVLRLLAQGSSHFSRTVHCFCVSPKVFSGVSFLRPCEPWSFRARDGAHWKCQTDGYRSDGPKRLVVVDRTGHRVQTRRTPTREVRSRRKVLFPRFVEAHHKSLQLLRSELCVYRRLRDDRWALEHTGEYCPTLFSFMGGEAFASSLGNVLDQWVLSLFIGCAPHRLLEHLWDHLLLPSPYHPAESKMMMRGPAVAPRGLIMACSFSLAALCCCGEEHYAQSDVLRQVKEVRVSGACIEDITLEAGEIVMGIRSRLLQWEEKDDTHLLSTATRIIVELLGVDGSGGDRLWKECCVHKSRIMDYSGDIDNQFRALVQGTHFDISEIGRLREALRSMPKAGRSAEGCDRETFGQLVRDTVPDFPSHLCDRLFDKLDPFKVGHLTFVELVCGISALSLGSMDEKLQVCFVAIVAQAARTNVSLFCVLVSRGR